MRRFILWSRMGVRHLHSRSSHVLVVRPDPSDLGERRGRPKMIVGDNGTELTSMAMLRRCQETQIDWHYITRGKPVQEAFIEPFDNSIRDEL